MADKITLADISNIFELSTLHGRIENWVFQTSVGNSQQIKIIKPYTYTPNAVSTSLRIRARAIMRYCMGHFNPAVDPAFSDFIKDVYLDTIYVFQVPNALIKTRYMNIKFQDTYTIFRSDQVDPIYQGILNSNQSFTVEVPDEADLILTCYKDTVLIHSINLKMVDANFKIDRFFEELFELVNFIIPQFDYPDGMVFVTDAIIFAGTAI
ncbi:MAG: hypothetical protein KAH01_07530 [Caldisericia bacterium]|nr:hypothetical protein [Caldisericia bacterium]